MKIVDGIFVKFIEELKVENNCYWQLDNKTIVWSCYSSDKEKDAHIGNTFGSYDPMMCFSNELRFGILDSELKSASLVVPEEELDPELAVLFLENIQSAEKRTGNISIVEKTDEFKFELSKYKYFDSKNNIFYGVSDLLLGEITDAVLLRLDCNFGLFFSNGYLAGWCLMNATTHLTLSYEKVSSERMYDCDFIQLYLSFFNSEREDQFDDGQLKAKKELLNFIDKLKNGDFKLNSKLEMYAVGSLENCLDFYYG